MGLCVSLCVMPAAGQCARHAQCLGGQEATPVPRVRWRAWQGDPEWPAGRNADRVTCYRAAKQPSFRATRGAAPRQGPFPPPNAPPGAQWSHARGQTNLCGLLAKGQPAFCTATHSGRPPCLHQQTQPATPTMASGKPRWPAWPCACMLPQKWPNARGPVAYGDQPGPVIGPIEHVISACHFSSGSDNCAQT